MAKYVKKISVKVTAEEARAIYALTHNGEFRISVGELFRKLLAAEAKRQRVSSPA